MTDEHRKNRLASALQFLTQYNEQGNYLIERIVTGDETRVHFWTQEIKEQSRVWKTKGEETPKKFKQVPSARKVLLTTFWDSRRLIYAEFATDKPRINQHSYFDTSNHLKVAIKNKGRDLLSRKPWLLHNNARSHTAALVVSLLENFHRKVFGHSPYSPDLAPSNYHLFPRPKKELRGKRFAMREELIAEVNRILQNLGAQFYCEGIEKLVARMNKCLDRDGNYIEK